MSYFCKNALMRLLYSIVLMAGFILPSLIPGLEGHFRFFQYEKLRFDSIELMECGQGENSETGSSFVDIKEKEPLLVDLLKPLLPVPSSESFLNGMDLEFYSTLVRTCVAPPPEQV
jgi:hypothetical protein